MILRTPEGDRRYQEAKKSLDPNICELCKKEPLKLYKHWKIVENSFPYDLIAKVHHMIIPLRHIKEDELTEEEVLELQNIKKDFINNEYNYSAETLGRYRSLPNHYHIHLMSGEE